MTKLFVAGVMFAAVCAPPPKDPNGLDPRDITGNYDVTYDNKLRVQVNVGGAVREVTQTGYGGVTDFGIINGQPVQIRLQDFCDKPEVVCPAETFWTKVAIDQPNLEDNGFDLQPLQVIDNTVHNLDAGQKAKSVGGIVDHAQTDKYLLGLGAQAGTAGACGAIDVSFSTGRFSHANEKFETTMEYRDERGQACNPDAGTMMTSDAGAGDAGTVGDAGTDAGVVHTCTLKPITRFSYPSGARVDGIKDGRIGFAWAGGCAFGPVLVGATLYLETGYTGKRTGDFDPPPFTPAPVVLPDAGFPEDAGQADGG